MNEKGFKAYAYLSLMDDKRIYIQARMEGTPGAVDEGIVGDMFHIVEVGEEWWEIPYEKLYSIAESGGVIDMDALEGLAE